MSLPMLLRQSSEGGGEDIYNDYSSAGIWVNSPVKAKLATNLTEKDLKEYENITSQVFGDVFEFYNR